jgi:hypothetical protein
MPSDKHSPMNADLDTAHGRMEAEPGSVQLLDGMAGIGPAGRLEDNWHDSDAWESRGRGCRHVPEDH